MRNLKRALSLTLASVMLLGMMVVGSSAASYPDVSDEDNVEAIEVLQKVAVMEGDNNGNFNPDDYVTREQMAVIMSKLLNLDYNYYQGTNPFSDVPAWAAPYVAACAANGITSGIGGGMYGAGQNVNAVQAALMMLKALGYFQYQQDFGDDYVLATVKQATEIGLFKLIDSNANQALTRNEVAQMALNALQADLVRFTGDPGVEYTGSNGESWIGGYKAEYTPRTSTDPKYNRLIDNKHSSNIDYSGQYYCQLGEELYNGDLVKRVDSDIFERPAYTWTYKTEKIGTYVDREKRLETYTKGVEGRTLYDLLNNITIRDYDLEVYVDGHEAGRGTNYTTNGDYYGTNSDGSYKGDAEVIASSELRRSNTNNLGITGDGVLTEVFIDRDKEIITIVSIHTWLAQATSNYSETRNSAGLKVFTSLGNSGVVSASKTVNVEDVPEVEGVTADTFYLVQMSDKDTTDLEIVSLDEPQILAESTITKFSNGKDDSSAALKPTKLTTDGTEYNDSNRMFYDADTLNQYDQDLLSVNTYNVYLDKYGYFIGVDLFEGAKQYVFVTGYDMKNSNLSIKTAEAAGIFLDGTMKNLTVNVKDTNKNIKSMVEDKTTSNSNATPAELTNSKAYYKQWGTGVSDGVYLLNRWYTYTVTDDGVYTLKPCVDKDGVAMMLASKTQDVGTDDQKTLKLHCSSLRLDSVTDSGDDQDGDLLMGESMTYTTSGLTNVRAYGEDASVFITVDVDEVSASAGGDTIANKLDITKAITDVNGVYTGIQDVDIITTTADRIQGKYYINNQKNPNGSTDSGTIGETPASAANDAYDSNNDKNGHWVAAEGDDSYLAENAYAVFDKNNFIIGAVILGEAEGNAATKAYILDPVTYERRENNTYYWQFEAVIDGEVVKQEAKGDFDAIDTMRNNRYEVVELRYNSDGVVTSVKQLDRKDSGAGTITDKIYGNPFDEITNHRVDDKESIYDVVLTGDDNDAYDQNKADAGVQFKYVTRPRYQGMNSGTTAVEHAASGKVFGETRMGTLKLQGRTLYVLNNQDDYGIDFVRDAKAVVRQPVNGEMKTQTYATVSEAIGVLGDVNPATDAKEFRGIITAVLNSSGVAEWIVFYSDTNVETLNDSNIGQAYINVDVWVELPGGSASYRETVKVYRPTNGTDIAKIDAPTIAGYEPDMDSISIVWSKDYSGHVTFKYHVPGEEDTEETMIVKINSILPGTGVITSERVIHKNDQTVGGKYMINPPAYNGYECLESAKGVSFNKNGAEVSYTYKTIANGTTDQSAPAGGGIGHPTDGNYATEYGKAGLTITTSGSPETKLVYTISGKISDIEAYLNKEGTNAGRPNTILQGGTDGNKMSIGAVFTSPKDTTGTYATSVDLIRSGHSAGDNQERPGNTVTNGSFVEWLTITAAGTANGNGTYDYTGAGREINKTLTYVAIWHFGTKTMTTTYDIVFNITK